MDVDVKVNPGAARVLAEVSRGVRLIARLLEVETLVDVLAADVDVARARAHGGSRDEATFEEFVRVVPHDLAIFARAGFGLVGVDDQVRGTAVADLGHEGPLETGGETCTSASAQARRLHLVHDPVGTHEHELLGVVPVAALHGPLQERVVLPVQVGEDAVLVAEAAVGSAAGVDVDGHAAVADTGRGEGGGRAEAPASPDQLPGETKEPGHRHVQSKTRS
mmetsp:Transcript_9163/g.41720  ORF Transcript_9163/g.41720 Transcript_9163/m.41720 type:complete len:221 (+) Transcript_9163:1753-2415(+)